MYFRDITGNAYKHYGAEFDEYPFEVADSGIHVNHYCELKSYARRLEKMKRCLRTLHPGYHEGRIEELAMHHPRVTLDVTSTRFGKFAFGRTETPPPDVFAKYHDEFEAFKGRKKLNGRCLSSEDQKHINGRNVP